MVRCNHHLQLNVTTGERFSPCASCLTNVTFPTSDNVCRMCPLYALALFLPTIINQVSADVANRAFTPVLT